MHLLRVTMFPTNNKTGNVRVTILTRVCVTITAVEKQLVLHIPSMRV